MVTYLLTFGFILILLFSAVFMHMSLGLNHTVKEDTYKEDSRPDELHDILFSK
jgi:hypothetical protein